MQRQRDETVSMFSKRFSSFYHKMHKEIQLPEAATMLCYATTFYSDYLFFSWRGSL
jgi:hypothetical protein